MKIKALVVEDNRMNSRLIKFVLEQENFEVLVSKSAEEAIVIAGSERPDIILMDVQLPGMDGLEATGLLKNNPATARIPIVAITAHAMHGDQERVRAAGCEGYISKPINTRELAAIIEGHLNK